MKTLIKIFLAIVSVIAVYSFINKDIDKNILTYTIDLESQNIEFYWKNTENKNYYNFLSLKKDIESKGKKLVFAMNGGMFKKDYSPQGLYIENGKLLSKIDTIQKAYGNFYMQPNGVFYITKTKKAFVVETVKFVNKDIKYATQSGPILLINGKIHSKFKKESKSLNIRNGVGILPSGKIIFAMSKEKINFHTFANYFKSLGCKNALYLDGYVSKTYLPSENWNDLDGNFGVIIAEVL